MIPDEYPFLVYYITVDTQTCGGSLIQDQWVLIAAHCVRGWNPKDMAIYLGAYNVEDPSNYEVLNVAEVHMHESYNFVTGANDIAILKLQEPVANVTPIDYHLSAEAEAQQLDGCFTLAGWGRTTATGTASSTPHKVGLKLMNNDLCQKLYNYDLPSTSILSTMICAWDWNQDACQGDSGGPLFTYINSTFIQTGSVSFGQVCGDYNHPGIYSRVSSYVAWIDATIKKALENPGTPECEGDVVLQASTGSISDGSSVTVDYSNNMACTWTIRVPDGYYVRTWFTAFSLEGSIGCDNDYVEIWAGKVSQRYCGNILPKNQTWEVSNIQVIFMTDTNVVSSGWTMRFASVKITAYNAETYPEEESKKSSVTFILVLGVLLGGIVFLGALFLLYKLMKNKRNRIQPKEKYLVKVTSPQYRLYP